MSTPSPVFAKVVKASGRQVKNYSESERQYHRENWRRSGLSMNQYCQQTGLAVSSLSTWLSVANKAMAVEPIARTRAHKPTIKIVLANGIKLYMSEIPALDAIVKLIQAVSACS